MEIRKSFKSLALAAGAVFTSSALAQTDPRAQIPIDFDKAIKGKTVAWVPLTLSTSLGIIWTHVLRENFEKYGIKFIVRDPNFDTDAQLQAVTSLINEKPDVLVVQNANISLLTRELKRAMDEGIFVIQVNMASNQPSDAYVGVDNVDSGRIIATDIVAECGGGNSSGKVALVAGEPTSAGSLEQPKGAMEVFDANESIEVVSTQAANWDSNKAYQITSTVLQQHSDLCATYGFWGVMQQGAARAVEAAGLKGKVKVYASSDGISSDCDMVEQGLFHKVLSYRADFQGQQITDAVLALLQGDDEPGTKNLVYLSNNYWVESEADREYCYELPKD
ncbi:MAG: sugar ABC transporter substrate-binding protein [Gammaproteobacteria bacterium]